MMSTTESTRTFFRQSGWMVTANTVCGVFMAAVHPLVQGMPPAEYGVFFTMLRLFMILSIPAAGLQTVFAQQAAGAISDERRRDLVSTAHAVFRGTFLFWLMLALAATLALPAIVSAFKISNPAIVAATLLLVLFALWLPIVQGLLQGHQSFLWLGWSMIANGVGRFSAIALLVVGLGCWAAGGIFGAVAGFVIALAIGTAAVWRIVATRTTGRFDLRQWLRRVLPLTLGPGAIMFVLNADMLIVQGHFPEKSTPFYAAGAMIGQALVLFTAPVAAVMFPKIAHSVARSQSSNALRLTLLSTASVGIAAALVCTIFPKLPLQILFFTQKQFVASAPLVPWFAWAMVPVTLANVLVSNLLARNNYAIVPWLVVIAVIYAVVLVKVAAGMVSVEPIVAFRAIAQVLAGCGVAVFGVAAFFTNRSQRAGPRVEG